MWSFWNVFVTFIILFDPHPRFLMRRFRRHYSEYLFKRMLGIYKDGKITFLVFLGPLETTYPLASFFQKLPPVHDMNIPPYY